MSLVPCRLIAIDIDGTLLCPRGTVTPRTRAAIHAAAQAGIHVCFATGRSWRESRHIVDSCGHFDIAVFATGAQIVDTRTGHTLHRTRLDPDLARQAAEFFETRGQTVLAMQDSEQAGVDYLVTEATPLNASSRSWLKMTQMVVQRRSDLATHGHEHTMRISIVAEAEDVEPLETEFSRLFGTRAICQFLIVPSSRMRVLEVFGHGVNKWTGVLHVAGVHGVTPEQIVAVGDDTNDLSMIRAAALGAVMANAPDYVRSEGRRVIGHNGEDGLAIFIEELVAANATTDHKALKGLALLDSRRT
jgi:Cof subfamily protein (haloacid dehalogenase superfamily)